MHENFVETMRQKVTKRCEKRRREKNSNTIKPQYLNNTIPETIFFNLILQLVLFSSRLIN